jgi:hypothetical protein
MSLVMIGSQPLGGGAGGAEPNVKPAELYRARCAQCHGDRGQGADEYPQPLAGNLSVAQLAASIAETMPADDPGSLSGEQYQAIAAYVHETFYSALARERNRPARVELARLTVRQHRQALADLVGSFREPVRWSDQRGLRAEYFAGRHMGSPVARRVDRQVDFDFATQSPVPEITEPHEFSIRWQGSFMATDTGLYDFVVRTEHAARLWINDQSIPLIDAWVKSGNESEHKGSLFLIGGRIYPLRLDFTKAKQGVDDSDKQTEKPKSAPASVRLWWKAPRGVLEPIPSRQLSADGAPEQFVCTVPFPADDRSYGWERGNSVSKVWDEATTEAAIEVAGYVAEHADRLAGTRPDAADRRENLQSFCRTFCERAFRSPLADDQVQTFVARQFEAADDDHSAVKRVVLLALKSPRFLFREVSDSGEPHHVAARLSFGLWDSIPDQELARAAAEDRLATNEQIAEQARRMLSDYRAKRKLRDFLLTWLHADAGKDLSKDSQAFPDFDAATIADLRTSLELFLEDVLASNTADYRRLLLSDEVYLNERLAAFYGGQPSPGQDFKMTRLDSGERAGILTHPYMMASFAHTRESSPIHRGVFLTRGVLGQSLRPPPVAVAPLAADLHPDLTTRQRVMLQTQAADCMTCHQVINPLGFALERFDAVGHFRDQEHGKPIDSTGSYRTAGGEEVTFDGARSLAEFLVGSEEAHTAFTEQLFHYLVQQPVRAYGATTLEELRDRFVAGGFNIRELAVEIMIASAPIGRQPTTVAAAR